MKRIPTLDGWRGIAILIVLLSHLAGILKLGPSFNWIAATGQHGVTIFFVLSGFLITITIAINQPTLKQFYAKRFFRLMPAAWVYLLFLPVAGAILGVSMISTPEAFDCLLFVRNFHGQMGQGMTAHFWSLSIEEQFYFVWPPILLALGNKRAIAIATLAITAISINRFIQWTFYDRMYFNFRTEARADALLIGCVAALLLVDPAVRPIAQRTAKYASAPAAAIFVFCFHRYTSLAPTTESVAIAILIIASLAAPRSHLASPLQLPPLRWMGRASYSFYLWNLFFVLLSGPAFQTMVMMFLMCCIATGSYYLIEKNGIALGRAFSTVKMPRQSLITDL